MKCSNFSIARLACAYFFFCPGLVYGLLTARLPALKAQTASNEAQIGLILLCFGLSGLIALLCSSSLIARWSSRTVLRVGSILLLLALVLCGFASSSLTLGISCALAGFGMGLTDVAMNAQGIEIERRFQSPCMSLMHAAYSFGGVLGSISGALFAAMLFSPLINFLCVLGLYSCLRPLAATKLQNDRSENPVNSKSSLRALPLFVFGCGLLALLAYSIEGSVAEWGSLLLFSVKGASEQVAALVFAVFSATTVICRLFGDRLRKKMGDFYLTFSGALLATLGMTLVLASPIPSLCLIGYAAMGIGLAPIVPILFSRAGTLPGVSVAQASSVVAFLAYGGLLFVPPTLGILAHNVGLAHALLVILALSSCLTLGTFLLKIEKV